MQCFSVLCWSQPNLAHRFPDSCEQRGSHVYWPAFYYVEDSLVALQEGTVVSLDHDLVHVKDFLLAVSTVDKTFVAPVVVVGYDPGFAKAWGQAIGM